LQYVIQEHHAVAFASLYSISEEETESSHNWKLSRTYLNHECEDTQPETLGGISEE